MLHNDSKDDRRNQRIRRIAQEQASPDLYAARAALKSDDAIEAEIEAMEAEENRAIDRASEEIAQAFAAATVTTKRWAA